MVKRRRDRDDDERPDRAEDEETLADAEFEDFGDDEDERGPSARELALLDEDDDLSLDDDELSDVAELLPGAAGDEPLVEGDWDADIAADDIADDDDAEDGGDEDDADFDDDEDAEDRDDEDDVDSDEDEDQEDEDEDAAGDEGEADGSDASPRASGTALTPSGQPLKRKRGRPRTRPLPDPNAPKRPRGRPRKLRPFAEFELPKRPRGRPRIHPRPIDPLENPDFTLPARTYRVYVRVKGHEAFQLPPDERLVSQRRRKNLVQLRVEALNATNPQLVSVRVGQPQQYEGRSVDEPDNAEVVQWTSSIVKSPVDRPLICGPEGLESDERADKTRHGGQHRAVCVMPAEHYAYWKKEFGRLNFPVGVFGENFQTEGLDEKTVCIGDVWATENVRYVVTQPRWPCWKVAQHVGYRDFIILLRESRKTGWFMRPVDRGRVEPGRFRLLHRMTEEWTVEKAYECMFEEIYNPAWAVSLATMPMLSEPWRELLLQRADQLFKNPDDYRFNRDDADI